VARGFSSMERLGKSPVYETLKNEDGFQDVLTEIEKNNQDPR
jgi:hypothetical protein